MRSLVENGGMGQDKRQANKPIELSALTQSNHMKIIQAWSWTQKSLLHFYLPKTFLKTKLKTLLDGSSY